MNKLIPSIIILSLLFGGIVFAQETELPDPGLTPKSPFYFLETIAEGIGTLFTFGDLKKAERYTTLAAERLAETEVVRKEGKLKLAEKTLDRYENQLEKALFRAEKAETEGKDTKEVAKIITEATYKHLIILNEVLDKAPEEAKPAIERAMTVSVKGHEKAVELLRMKSALSEVLEGASLPAGIPEEVMERIQRKAQEELEREKILQAVKETLKSSDKSLRDLCIESAGGEPSAIEMCEKIPLKGFKSFKALETFCKEMGGPPEVCESFESTCKEQLGLTKADECFRALTSSSSVRIRSSIKQFDASDERFESFETLKVFCIEDKGPPEICSSLEARCEELGIITPYECYRVLSISRIEPAPVPEKTMEEMRAEEEAR